MGDNAPMYVIDNTDVTDDRIVGIQSPQTSEALRLNYSYVTNIDYEIKDHSIPNLIAFNKLYIKKNKPSGQIAEKKPFAEYKITKGNVIAVPKDAEFFSIDYELGLTGHLARLFWKIPEIVLKAEFKNYTITGNIVIDNLSYPAYLHDISRTVNQGESNKPNTVIFKGKGMDYIKNIKINFYKGTDYVAE